MPLYRPYRTLNREPITYDEASLPYVNLLTAVFSATEEDFSRCHGAQYIGDGYWIYRWIDEDHVELVFAPTHHRKVWVDVFEATSGSRGYIVTIEGRTFRLVGSIEEDGDEAPTAGSQTTGSTV